MNDSLVQRLRFWLLTAALLFASQPPFAVAEVVPVRHVEGTLHGFLELRTQENQLLAVGDLFQVVRGDRVNAHLVFHFKDGSLDDETAVFLQRRNFQLISDHHVQKGPAFPHPLDVTVDVRSGQVTVRSTGDDGKQKVDSKHLTLPPDLANGVIFSLLKNIKPTAPETKVSMIVATPKPRLVKLAISPHGEESFSIAESQRKAMHFVIKVEIGGAAGLVAPLVGKQPPDIHVWISGGEAPAFVKEVGPLYEGGPICTVQLTSPVWPH